MPHPVLSKQRQDYRPECQFSIITPQAMLAAGGKEIAISVKYLLTSSTLLALIAEKRANYVTLVESSRTYRRESYAAQANEDLLLLKRTDWQGTITLTPYVAATEEIEGFSAPEHNPLIKALAPTGTDLPAGAILAIGDITEVELEEDPSVESIFDLVPSRQMQLGSFATNLTGQRIAINLHPDDLARVNTARNQTRYEPILHQALYLHALEKAIQNLPDHADKRWARVVQHKLEEQSLYTEGDALTENSERYAQTIFQNPLARMLNNLQEEISNE